MVSIIEIESAKQFEQIVGGDKWQPLVTVIPELAVDTETRLRTANFIGSVALDSVTVAEEQKPTYTLMDAIQKAAEGDPEAYKMVRSNVATDVVERSIKSGHVVRVKLDVDEAGQIVQHGQTANDIQKNSLRYTTGNREMRKRTEAETRNMFRIEEANNQGLLEEYAFVAFSRAPDDMTVAASAEAGFFTDTMSCAIQVTTMNDEELSVESAFVAGRASWDAPRHDTATLNKVGGVLGVQFEDKTATEILDTPLLIHKSLIPNGVIDLVRVYDTCADGTFFGEAVPRQDYISYREKCKQREAVLEPRIENITKQLIAESAILKSPQIASQRLSKLSEAEMLELSVVDTSINPRVFGEVAAYRIEHARSLVASGQLDQLRTVIDDAKSVAKSSSCPGGVEGGAMSTGIDNRYDNNKSGSSSRCGQSAK